MSAQPSAPSSSIATLSTERGTNRLRPWKQTRKESTSQTQKSGKLGKKWEQRLNERKQTEATKKLERDLKQDKEVQLARRKTIAMERRTALEEKRRVEDLASKVSAKKLQRLKKRLNRSKKVRA
ncbi:MAG: hypothetical protein CYPHOPRED_004598 [Cyphobasidiales sp. Tagirdzhanova-0007]|nr:MAG: hypothetical protein CYPHOPRED_004598 [Cyphobasidiales sp. Tagirdzhanova-0007]